MPGDRNDEIRAALHDHLGQWGLRRFESDRDYFAWQQQRFTPQEIAALHQAVERKREGGTTADIAFYDLTAQPQIIPVLYSQRYDYYIEVGARVASLIGAAETILDVGCGIGLLTIFYAARHRDRRIVGVDRSSASLDIARQRARELGLTNVHFEHRSLDDTALPGTYDLIIATHALFQVEQELGLPSRSWRTFERADNPDRQRAFEERTGLGLRLDRLCAVLAPAGRAVIFEKARLLSRRVPFQRALAARGLAPIARPEPIRYSLVEDITEDGPLYVLTRGHDGGGWDESPESDDAAPLNFEAILRQPGNGEEPLYENHQPSAQEAWTQIPERTILQEATRDEPDGRQLHVELGASRGMIYLYVANTFDQRQLVIVEAARRVMLDNYYRDIVRA